MSFDQIGVIKAHMLGNGFHDFYTQWIFHGEKLYDIMSEVDNVAKNANVDEMVNVLMTFSNLPLELLN